LEELKTLASEVEFLEINEGTTINTLIDKAKKASFEYKDQIQAFLNEYRKIPVVNPTKEKFKETVLDLNYYELLRYYSNELEKENTILFVLGFSMADEHIRKMTIRLAESNPTLLIIIVAYDDGSKENIQKTMNVGDIFGNIKYISPKEGEKLDFENINEKIFKQITDLTEKK
jgi:hypothetical protein